MIYTKKILNPYRIKITSLTSLFQSTQSQIPSMQISAILSTVLSISSRI